MDWENVIISALCESLNILFLCAIKTVYLQNK